MNRRNRTYKLPSTSEIALKDGLSTKLKELWSTAAHNSFELYLYAAALRKKYLNDASGDYKPEFREWYETHEIYSILGKMPSFTKYAMAGEVVNYFANEFHDGKYVTNLPVTRNALYEISLLLNEVDELELEKLFFAGGEDGDPLITPTTSAPQIASYRSRLKAKPIIKSDARNRTFTIPLATIYVSRDLYKFNKRTGEHEGLVNIEEAKALLNVLQGTLNLDAFDIRTSIDKISTKFEERKRKAAPSRALRQAKEAAE